MQHSAGGTGGFIHWTMGAIVNFPNSQVIRGATAEAEAGRDSEGPSTLEILDIERRQRMAAMS